MEEQHKGEGESAVAAEKQGEEGQVAGNLLRQFEQILHDDPLIDEVGFLHPTQFCSLDFSQNGNSRTPGADQYQRYFWCRDHKLAISSEVLLTLYRAARDAYTNARTACDTSTTDLMSHSKALLILCPDSLTSWNSRKMVLSLNYDYTMLKDELQLCALILSYSPKNESTWSHRRWVIKKVAEQHQSISEIIEKESGLVKEIAEKSKMNYRAWRHRCWLINYMTRKQVLNELKESTSWSELHVADNCCFHYRRVRAFSCDDFHINRHSLLLALRERNLENGSDSLRSDSESCLVWKEELRWNESLVRRFQGRESLWIHRRFLSQWWIQQLFSFEEKSSISPVDAFVAKEMNLLQECINAPSDDEFEESRAQAELAALYILWISKQVPTVKEKLEERMCSTSMGRLEDVLGRACRPEKKRLWMSLLGLAVSTHGEDRT